MRGGRAGGVGGDGTGPLPTKHQTCGVIALCNNTKALTWTSSDLRIHRAMKRVTFGDGLGQEDFKEVHSWNYIPDILA